eukprot:9290842-Pyramimonas_sp.AAC.1
MSANCGRTFCSLLPPAQPPRPMGSRGTLSFESIWTTVLNDVPDGPQKNSSLLALPLRNEELT